MGCGAFARKTIPEGTIIAQYTGELKNKHIGLRWFFEYGIGLIGEDLFIDAAGIGNITRLINHLPCGLQSTLPYTKRVSLLDYSSEVATENVIADENHVFRTARDIHPGEQLGWDYTSIYWDGASKHERKSIRPIFFCKYSSGILQCAVDACSNPGVYHCKQCKKKRYCSEACQRLDWRAGHKEACRHKCHYFLCSEPLSRKFSPCRVGCTAKYCSKKCEEVDYEKVHKHDCIFGVTCSRCVKLAHEWYSCCKAMRFCGGHCYRAGLKSNPQHQCDVKLEKLKSKILQSYGV